MVGEESDARPEKKIQHLYEEGGFTPLARVESFGAGVLVPRGAERPAGEDDRRRAKWCVGAHSVPGAGR